jgi:hypothetical protein
VRTYEPWFEIADNVLAQAVSLSTIGSCGNHTALMSCLVRNVAGCVDGRIRVDLRNRATEIEHDRVTQW